MATCLICGKWLGQFKEKHREDDPCPGPPAPVARPTVDVTVASGADHSSAVISFDAKQLAEHLAPVVLKAGVRAGIAAALTLIVAGILAGMIHAVLFP